MTVTLHRAGDAPHRLVLSGWKIGGSSLVTGSLFMYRMRDGREALFNTISIRLEPLEEGKEPAPRIRHLRSG